MDSDELSSLCDEMCGITAIVGPVREGQTLFERVEEFLREKDAEIAAAKTYAARHLAHLACLKAATLEDSLHITIRVNDNGVGCFVQKVLSTRELGLDTILGRRAIFMTVDEMMNELNAALARGRE